MLNDWAAIDSDGKWVHNLCGGSIPRQAGKSVGCIGWCVVLTSILGYKVLWTDHNYSTTSEMLKRFRVIFGRRVKDPEARYPSFNKRVKAVNNKTAQEAFEFVNGGVLAFSTRTKSATLGYSFDVVVYDEAQELTAEQVQAITPTTTSGSKKNPQIIYLGTPTRAGSSATVFKEIRTEAWSEKPGSDLCWIEYGVSEVGDVNDESRWYKVNPSLGTLANIEAIRIGKKGGMGDLAFAQEYLGYWLPDLPNGVITKSEWDACKVSAEQSAKAGRLVYGVKFSPDGKRFALAVALKPDTGNTYLELVFYEDTSRGTAGLVQWLIDRKHKAACVVVDGRAGADALLERLAPHMPRNSLIAPRIRDVIAAAAGLETAIKERTITHIGQAPLDASATGSTRRSIGRDGGWGFGGEDSAPIEAAALALWGVKTTKRDPSRKQVIW